MTLRLVDPTIATTDEVVPAAARPRSLDGVVLGLIDNGKAHGKLILDRIVENLGRKYRIAGTRYLRKASVSMPPEDAEVDALAEVCGAILAAVGD